MTQVPVPLDSTTGVSLVTPAPADASQALRALLAVRDAAIGTRRAKLAKFVRGVVVVSTIVCVAAIARAIFGASPADEPLPTRSLQSRAAV